MIRRIFIAAVAAGGMLMFAAAAGAQQLGVIAPPSGAGSNTCSGQVIGQFSDDAATPYIIPSPGGEITAWQTYTVNDTSGDELTLVVLAPTDSTGDYTVVATDTETLPTPLPADHTATFTLSQPMTVAAGDTLGMYESGIDICYFNGGSTPAADKLLDLVPATGTLPPSTGEALAMSGPSTTPASYTLNLAATLVKPLDAGVTAASTPASVTLGSTSVLQSVVTNSGPLTAPITFTDRVPSGLQVVSAAAGLGTCSISGQIVTCTITGLPVGQTSTVDVVVTDTTAGSYANAVGVTLPDGYDDLVASNNTASGGLVVNQPVPTTSTTPTPTPTPTRACIVPKLPKISVASARTLLTELGCTVHVSTKHSTVKKGLVIGLKGKTGTFAYHKSVTLIVSSGRKPKKKRR
jgi:uncharacterized repeat protein (TIGR01451 family)